jgi:hypothetical protein
VLRLISCQLSAALRAAPRPEAVRSFVGTGTLVLAALCGACTSPSVAGEIKNEPICADFDLGGAAKMKGSLRKPVQVTILEDDDTKWQRVLFGKRSADDKASVFSVEDDDEKYTVRWAQCANEFAPKPVDDQGRTTDAAVNYTCGEATPYTDAPFEVKEGDAASRVIEWAEPPDARCWAADTPAPK